MKTTRNYILMLMIIAVAACGQTEEKQSEKKEKDKDKTEERTEVNLSFPAVSPRAEVSQKVGVTSVSIDYSRPSVNDRVIWGELVPFDEMWRTGANQPTTIKFDKDVSINGHELDAGKYALFTIPAENGEWTFIFNKEGDLSSVNAYDESKDALRIQVTAETSDHFREMMSFYFKDVTSNSAKVVLAWESLKTTFVIETETDKQVMAMIDKAIKHADEDDWATYSSSAAYLIGQGENLDQAEEWLLHSLEIEQNWRNSFTKARLKEARGENEAAIEWYEKAIEAGNAQDENFGAEGFLRSNIERLEKEL